MRKRLSCSLIARPLALMYHILWLIARSLALNKKSEYTHGRGRETSTFDLPLQNARGIAKRRRIMQQDNQQDALSLRSSASEQGADALNETAPKRRLGGRSTKVQTAVF